jgi:hypothetical protein
MEIKRDMEIDCGSDYLEGSSMFRLSIKKTGPSFEVQKHVFLPLREDVEVEFSGDLCGCIQYVACRYGGDYHVNRKKLEVKIHGNNNHSRNI